jgi:hypothetical protein
MVHCGECPECRAGRAARCRAPVRGPVPPAPALAAATADLVAAWDQPAPVVLLAGAAELSGQVLELLAAVPVRCVAEPDPAARRPGPAVLAELAALTPTGRADVVVSAGTDLATCARWVRRGGAIGAAVRTGREPSLDTVTERELTVLSPRRPPGRPAGWTP